MPGGSSATKEEPAGSGPPPLLLGATGSTGQDNQATNPITGSRSVSPATATIAEGARQREKYSLLVRIFTTRGRQSLEPHAWVEDLLKDFFQSILGINLSVILLSPTECLIFFGNRAQGQGMSWDESLHYAHQLTGIHLWTGYMIDVVAHQRTLKEPWHEMQVAREFTHERTRESLIWTPWLWCQLWRPDWRRPRDCPRGEAWWGGPTNSSSNSSLERWISRSPPLCSTLPCWALNRTAPSVNSSIPPGNFGGPRIDASVFPCSRRLPRRMLSLTETGAVRSKMPWNMAMMMPRWRKRCLRPWRGWPETMLRWSMRMGICMLPAS